MGSLGKVGNGTLRSLIKPETIRTLDGKKEIKIIKSKPKVIAKKKPKVIAKKKSAFKIKGGTSVRTKNKLSGILSGSKSNGGVAKAKPKIKIKTKPKGNRKPGRFSPLLKK